MTVYIEHQITLLFFQIAGSIPEKVVRKKRYKIIFISYGAKDSPGTESSRSMGASTG